MATPSGSLETTFDELNRPYKVPSYCFCNPTNIISPSTPGVTKTKKDNPYEIPVFHQITLKIRVNPGDFNLNILASTADTIQDLKHFILQQSSQQVRLMNKNQK